MIFVSVWTFPIGVGLFEWSACEGAPPGTGPSMWTFLYRVLKKNGTQIGVDNFFITVISKVKFEHNKPESVFEFYIVAPISSKHPSEN